MSNYEQKDNTFTLFKNDKKTEDKHPDERGPLKIICPHCGQSSKHNMSVWNVVNPTINPESKKEKLRSGAVSVWKEPNKTVEKSAEIVYAPLQDDDQGIPF